MKVPKQINGHIGGARLKQRITETIHFNKLSSLGKYFILKRTNLIQIHHAVNVISNRGFDKWQEISNYNFNNIEIIKELIKKDENEQ